MVTMDRGRCRDAAAALAALRSYVVAEQGRVRNHVGPEFLHRDLRFLHAADSALSECDLNQIQALLGDMRGLRHYFGSYCSDLNRLDALIEALYASIQTAVRSGKNT